MGDDPQWLHQTVDDYSIWAFDHGLWLAGESHWSIDALTQIAAGTTSTGSSDSSRTSHGARAGSTGGCSTWLLEQR